MQKTPLYDEHLKLGGKIVDFNGWALPLQFTGIVHEHQHTRARASIFDCSHMGEYRIKGQSAIEAYDRQVISDTSKIPLGRCRYGAILSENGGILDDLITFRMAADELYVVTNAGPIASVTDRICGGNPGAEHVSYETAKIDVQGPLAYRMVMAAGFKDVEGLKYFNSLWTTWRGHRVLLSRTGYTGELGYELFMDNDLAPTLWELFCSMEDAAPAGLGARDTLRTEVCYGLSGQDFDSTVTPLESGMAAFIEWETEFVGKEALMAQRNRGDYRELVAVKTLDRRAPRHEFNVTRDGVSVGVVTSGTFGPSLDHGVGLARVDRNVSAPGTRLTAGPKGLPIEVCKIPIYTKGTCRAAATA